MKRFKKRFILFIQIIGYEPAQKSIIESTCVRAKLIESVGVYKMDKKNLNTRIYEINFIHRAYALNSFNQIQLMTFANTLIV